MSRVINDLHDLVFQDLILYVITFYSNVTDTNQHLFGDFIESTIWNGLNSICLPHNIHKMVIEKDADDLRSG
jgi:hypothetical protein